MTYNLFDLTAPCGIDCFNCEMFEKNITEEMKSRIAALVNCKPEDVPCKGCRIQGTCSVVMKDCKTLACVKEKAVDFCYECNEFPCSKLQPCASRAEKLPHNMKVFNLCRIKQLGLGEWAKETSENRKKYYLGNMVLGEGPILSNK